MYTLLNSSRVLGLIIRFVIKSRAYLFKEITKRKCTNKNFKILRKKNSISRTKKIFSKTNSKDWFRYTIFLKIMNREEI